MRIDTPAAPPPAPESSVEIVAPQSLTSLPVSGALQYWNRKRGSRRFASREEISPREMAPFLRNIVLIRVIDGGADFEYRVTGDAYVQAFGLNFKGLKLTDIAVMDPLYARVTHATYEHVRVTGQPFAVRGWVAPTTKSAFSYHETVFLPLGENDVVDHLLAASAFTPRGDIHSFTKEDRPPGGELPTADYQHNWF